MLSSWTQPSPAAVQAVGSHVALLVEESGVCISQRTLGNLPFCYTMGPSQLTQSLSSAEHLLVNFSTDVLLKQILLFILASCKTSEKIQNNNEKWLCSQNQVNPIIFLTELITIMSNTPLDSLKVISNIKIMKYVACHLKIVAESLKKII